MTTTATAQDHAAAAARIALRAAEQATTPEQQRAALLALKYAELANNAAHDGDLARTIQMRNWTAAEEQRVRFS